jgi:hypothetical protein
MILWQGEFKRQPFLGNATIKSDAAMEHAIQIYNGRSAGNGVFCDIRADSYVIKQ